MNFSFYKTLAWLILGVLLAASAVGLIIFSTDPFDSSLMVFVVFYLGIMLVVLGATTIVGLLVRKKWLETAQGCGWVVRTSVRQGLILGCMSTLILILLNLRWLSLYTFASLIILACGSEYFLSRFNQA